MHRCTLLNRVVSFFIDMSLLYSSESSLKFLFHALLTARDMSVGLPQEAWLAGPNIAGVLENDDAGQLARLDLN